MMSKLNRLNFNHNTCMNVAFLRHDNHYSIFSNCFMGSKVPGPRQDTRDAPRGGAGGAAAPPDFGRSEGAAGQRRRAALLPAPRIFDPWCIPDKENKYLVLLTKIKACI